MTQIASGALALAMIAAFLLIVGGAKLAMTAENRKRGILMILAALVLVGNVLIWTV
jgi:high-affinity Fe2+/Pb2+ permease